MWLAILIYVKTSVADYKYGMYSLHGTAFAYGKVVIAWDPKDKLPAFPPQVEMVQHPFMVNSTVTPEMHKGSFNQTLKY